MSLEIDLYMKNVISFFKKNPKNLASLIPVEMEDDFYDMIKQTARFNKQLGNDVTLTKTQLLEICKEINIRFRPIDNYNNIFYETKNWGVICLN